MTSKEALSLVESNPKAAAAVIVAAQRFMSSMAGSYSSDRVADAMGKGRVAKFNSLVDAMDALLPDDEPAPTQST